jgi:hypothetical protein
VSVKSRSLLKTIILRSGDKSVKDLNLLISSREKGLREGGRGLLRMALEMIRSEREEEEPPERIKERLSE